MLRWFNKVRPLEWFTIAVGCIAIVTSARFGLRQTPDRQLGDMGALFLLLLLVLVGLVDGAVRWKKDRLRAGLPLAIAILGLFAALNAGRIGASVRERRFVRDISNYEEVVSRLQASQGPRTDFPLDSLPNALAGCCYRVLASRDSTGILSVAFWVGGGFPVKHTAWLYYSADTLPPEIAAGLGWPRGRKLAPHWYRVSD